jgi:hypothetical protein
MEQVFISLVERFIVLQRAHFEEFICPIIHIGRFLSPKPTQPVKINSKSNFILYYKNSRRKVQKHIIL